MKVDALVAFALVVALVAGALAGCTSKKESEAVSQWAQVVTPDPTPVHSACDGKRPRVPEPSGTSASSTASYTVEVLRSRAAMDRKYDACSAWARGQR